LLAVVVLVPEWGRGPIAAQTKAKGSRKGTVTGTIKDTDAKPWPDITVSFKDDKGGEEVTAKSDAQGKYKIELPAGTYVVTVKQGDQDLYAVKAAVAADAETPADFNFKDPALASAMAEIKKQSAAQNKINNLKQHYQAGTTALNASQRTGCPDEEYACRSASWAASPN